MGLYFILTKLQSAYMNSCPFLQKEYIVEIGRDFLDIQYIVEF
mgnify:FL=1